MKIFRIISRNIRDSFKGVFRNFSLSIASISCITITLIVVSISIILSDNVNNFATLVEEDVTIVAFLSNDMTTERVNEINLEINKLDNIASVSFESKVEIAEEMKASSDVFNNLMQDWTEDENPLQNTYLIKVKDIEKIVILIVLVIKKAVTTIKAATITIEIFLTISNTDTNCSTIPSPYFTTLTPSITLI